MTDIVQDAEAYARKIMADAEAEVAKLKAEAEEELARLKAEAEAEAAPAPPAAAEAAEPEPPAPTHNLLLSDGTVIPHAGAIPTLVHIGEDVLAVVSAFERVTVP